MPENVTPEQIKEILKKNGITSIDELAKQLAENENSPSGTIVKEGQLSGELDSSWVIKVWKLSTDALEVDIKKLPDELGGDILKH